jgi:hypothetical protein
MRGPRLVDSSIVVHFFYTEMYPTEIVSKMKKKFPDLMRISVKQNEKVNKMKFTIDRLFDRK